MMKRYLWLGLLSACVSRPQLVPAGGAQMAVATVDNVTLTAGGNEWSGDSEIRDYLTPIAIDIHNGSRVDIQVDYKDFELVTDRGEKFAALNPYPAQPQAQQQQEQEPEQAEPQNQLAPQDQEQPRAQPALPQGAMNDSPYLDGLAVEPSDLDLTSAAYAYRGGGGGHGGGGGGGGGGTGRQGNGGGGGYHGGGFRGGGNGFHGGGFHGGGYGYHGGSAYRGGYGYHPGYGYRGGWSRGGSRGYGVGYRPYWNGGYGWRGYWSPWWGWGSGWGWPYYYYTGTPYYYYYGRDPDEIMQYGVNQGVVAPGGETEGFLFFQRATDHTQHATLRWVVHDKSGADLGVAKVHFDVVRD